MIRGDKELYVVGDRVLIRVDDMEERTAVGLYLPPTALEKENVQSGRVEEVGPGVPLPPKADDDGVPWEEGSEQMRYIGLQAKKGRSRHFPAQRRGGNQVRRREVYRRAAGGDLGAGARYSLTKQALNRLCLTEFYAETCGVLWNHCPNVLGSR